MNPRNNSLINTFPKESALDTGVSPAGMRSLGALLKIEAPTPKTAPQGVDADTLQETIRDLERDIYWMNYSSDAKTLDEQLCPSSRIAHKEVLDSLKESALFNKIDTVGNSFLSGMIAKGIIDVLMQDSDMQDAMSESSAGNGEQGNQKQDSQGGGNGNQDSDEQSDEQKEGEGGGDPDKARESAKNAMTKNGSALRSAAIMEGVEKAKNAKELVESFGLDAGQISTNDYQQCLDARDRMGQTRLTDLINKIGRAKGISVGMLRPSVLNPNGLICNAGLTRNIVNGFCNELAFLSRGAPKALRDLKVLEWADHGIMGMVEGSDPDRTGGLIIMVDNSGSMEGKRQMLAKALALGFAKGAEENNQKYAIRSFSSRGDEPSCNQSNPHGKDCWSVLTEKTPWIEHLQWATYSTSGGTDFDFALKHALFLLNERENKEEYDIIFITDGAGNLNDKMINEFLTAKEKYGTRLVQLRISSMGYSPLDELSSATVHINDSTNLEDAAELLSEALKNARSS